MIAHTKRQTRLYFGGQIRPKKRKPLFDHLRKCTQCRGDFDRLAHSHRALSGQTETLPATELDLIGKLVVANTEAQARRAAMVASKMNWRWAALPATAFLVLLALAVPRTEEWSQKGSARIEAPKLEALCFDLNAQPTAHIQAQGRCPAPGYIKILYASPQTTDNLTVAALVKTEVRFIKELHNPAPRSALGDHIALYPGEHIRIVSTMDKRPHSAILHAPASITIEGVQTDDAH